MIQIDFENYNREHACIWRFDPRKYPYVRKFKYICSAANYIPIKKKSCSFHKNGSTKKVELRLVGYTKPQRLGFRSYTGEYFYLKGYDKSMPDGHLVYDNGNDNYYPEEAVKFV